MNNTKKLIVPSLLVGVVITALLMAQMSWHTVTPCSYSASNDTTASYLAESSICASMQYGYPKRAITTKPAIGVKGSSKNITGEFQISATATIEVLWASLFFDLAVWSFACFLIFALLTHYGQKPAVKSTKKKK